MPCPASESNKWKGFIDEYRKSANNMFLIIQKGLSPAGVQQSGGEGCCGGGSCKRAMKMKLFIRSAGEDGWMGEAFESELIARSKGVNNDTASETYAGPWHVGKTRPMVYGPQGEQIVGINVMLDSDEVLATRKFIATAPAMYKPLQ